MRRLLFIPALLGLCVLATSVFANPYATQVTLSDSSFVYGTTTSIDVSFRLNEAADQVTVQIIGPAPSTEVVRSIVVADLPRGVNVVAWNGLNNLGGPVPNGDYSAAVKAENLAGYAAWTNITPIEFLLTEAWTTPTTEYGVAQGSNSVRGLGFDGTSIVVSSTTPRRISVLNANGEFQNTLSLTVTEMYDMNGDGYTTNTYSLDAWLGPYDIASAGNRMYLNAYRGAGFPVTLLNNLTAGGNPKALAPTGNARALDAVAGGLGNIVYANLGNANGVANNTLIFTTDNATTYTVIETATVFINSHMIVAKDGNTGGDGDVVWASTNTGNTRKYNRAAGAWTVDSTFGLGLAPWAVGGDYFVAGGRQFLALNTINGASKNCITIIDANTGEQIKQYVNPGTAGPFVDGNGDVTVSGSAIYFGAGQQALIGKLTFSYGEIGSAQYFAPTGVAVITEPTSPNFGTIAVASSRNVASSNGGATANQNGVYILNNDMTFVGGNQAASFAAAQNDPACPWDPADSFSPWKAHVGTSEKDIVYVGDWGTANVTNSTYRFDLSSTATAILQAGGANHGRVFSATTYTSGTRRLVGIDRDSGTYYKILGWNVDATNTNYTGASYIIANANNTGFGVADAYSHRDMQIDSNGIMYVCNRRSANTQTHVYAVNLATNTLVWAVTGASYGAPASSYPSGIALDEGRGLAFVFHDGDRTVRTLSMATGAAVPAYPTFTYGTGTGGKAIAADAAGNVYTTCQSDEHVRMWAPPSASTSYTTAGLGAVTMSSSPAVLNVPDWMVY